MKLSSISEDTISDLLGLYYNHIKGWEIPNCSLEQVNYAGTSMGGRGIHRNVPRSVFAVLKSNIDPSIQVRVGIDSSSVGHSKPGVVIHSGNAADRCTTWSQLKQRLLYNGKSLTKKAIILNENKRVLFPILDKLNELWADRHQMVLGHSATFSKHSYRSDVYNYSISTVPGSLSITFDLRKPKCFRYHTSFDYGNDKRLTCQETAQYFNDIVNLHTEAPFFPAVLHYLLTGNEINITTHVKKDNSARHESIHTDYGRIEYTIHDGKITIDGESESIPSEYYSDNVKDTINQYLTDKYAENI